MFGLGFWEILVIAVVGIVVLGPRKLPELMRTAGQWVSKLRRLSIQLRAESGIDDIIRMEGLEREIRELKSLAGANMLGTLAAATAGAPALPAAPPASRPILAGIEPLREREYPEIGCDAGGVLRDVFFHEPPPVEAPIYEASEPEPQPETAEAPVIPPRKPPPGTVATVVESGNDAPLASGSGSAP